MNWIVLVLVACSADSCKIVEAEANLVDDARELSIRDRCDAAPNCYEPRRGFFVIRQAPAVVPPAPPASTSPPAAPPPPSTARAPGARV